MNSSLRKWLLMAFFNLLVVAVLGVLLRYKIAFSMPFVNQRYLLQAHSHFAFAGWITQILMTLLLAYLSGKTGDGVFRKYRWLLYGNLATAYGMLLSFPFQGYATISIIFSTLSIFVSYAFAIVYWKDLNRLEDHSVSHKWFKAALLFNAISSLGPFTLAYMLASRHVHTHLYLTSVYFFLHFQYNGWFFFACMGLLCSQLSKFGIPNHQLKLVFLLFVSAIIPAYFLSALWLPIPAWIFALVILSVLVQDAGWLILVRIIRRSLPGISRNLPTLPRWFFLLSFVALSLKLMLQTISVIPALSKLTYGFRPIVIGYLHLIFLGVITLFILGYIIQLGMIHINKIAIRGLIIFTIGIFVNELLLMVQGIADLSNAAVPFINPMLLGAALLLFTGIFVVNYGLNSRSPTLLIHHELS